MEQDKQLKEILLNSAERASANFTGLVMNKVNGLSAVPSYQRPLVSPKLKRLFLFSFGALITAILSLCLILALSDFPVVSLVQGVELPDLNYTKILMFLFSFWFVFTINSLLEKKFLPGTRS